MRIRLNSTNAKPQVGISRRFAMFAVIYATLHVLTMLAWSAMCTPAGMQLYFATYFDGRPPYTLVHCIVVALIVMFILTSGVTDTRWVRDHNCLQRLTTDAAAIGLLVACWLLIP